VGGYERPEYWSEVGWAWRTETSDRKASKEFLDWLNDRPPDKRDRPYWWDDRQWNSPLFPVVGITWFEAEAYARWLSEQLRGTSAGKDVHEPRQGLVTGRLMVRLPTEAERGAAIGGRGAYPWGARFDRARLNCAESWAERRFSSETEWVDWIKSDAGSRRDAGTTAVTTYPQGASQTGVWDGSGNVWEWINSHTLGDNEIALRGGAWYSRRMDARISSRNIDLPENFSEDLGTRVVVGPVLK